MKEGWMEDSLCRHAYQCNSLPVPSSRWTLGYKPSGTFLGTICILYGWLLKIYLYVNN